MQRKKFGRKGEKEVRDSTTRHGTISRAIKKRKSGEENKKVVDE